MASVNTQYIIMHEMSPWATAKECESISDVVHVQCPWRYWRYSTPLPFVQGLIEEMSGDFAGRS